MKKILLILALIVAYGAAMAGNNTQINGYQTDDICIVADHDNSSVVIDQEKDKKKKVEATKEQKSEKAKTTGCSEAQKKSCAASGKTCGGEKTATTAKKGCCGEKK